MDSLHLAQQIFNNMNMGMSYQEVVPDFSVFHQMLLGPHTIMPVEHHHEDIEHPFDVEKEAHYRLQDEKIAQMMKETERKLSSVRKERTSVINSIENIVKQTYQISSQPHG